VKTATLVLQDGTVLEGQAFGARTDAIFELVFNTSMTGYQEILTDPSYRGQGVVFTTPHIGNVGINTEDDESSLPQIAALVVRRISAAVSNWRATQALPDWLQQHGIPGISEIDTRWLTRRLRERGTQKAALSSQGTPVADLHRMVNEWPGLDGRDMVKEVTCSQPYLWAGDMGNRWVPSLTHQETCRGEVMPPTSPGTLTIAAFDFGIKKNILRHLARYGARVTVVPATMTAKNVLSLQPHGIFLSNGPGDPAGLPYLVETVKELLDYNVPIFGICLGHQLIGRALGASTHRLKFGHHGGNHPVQYLPGSEVLITAQNHNYCVTPGDLDPNAVEITHLSLNDGSLEGFRLKNKPVLSVQFHPEASPGPHDAHHIFSEFFNLITEGQRNG